MATVRVAIRNQSGVPLTSIDGTAFLTLLTRDGSVIDQQEVSLFHADAIFSFLDLGDYTMLVRHPAVKPSEVGENFTISGKQDVLSVYFYYDEPKRRFSHARVQRAG